MQKLLLIITVLLASAACSTVNKVDQESSRVASGMSEIENSANNIDRAFATEERVRHRIDPKK